YEGGVAGSTGSNWLEISFTNLQPGWYVIFAGGSDHSLSTQNMTLSVNTAPVPEPETWAMLAAGLVGMAFMRRKQRA
ncbi:MAG: PEP-CTERM sorting domain-containing protein, partial [Betaproteobacteria bacterium]|nr:PEP-CTERM sorting domain-containing protein [Betaproteobacteria bacterium]